MFQQLQRVSRSNRWIIESGLPSATINKDPAALTMRAIFSPRGEFSFLRRPIFSLTLKIAWTRPFFSTTMDAPFFPDDCPASIKKERQPELYGPPPLLGVLCMQKELCEWANWLAYKFPKKTSGRASIQPDLALSFISQPRWEIFTLDLISGCFLRSTCCETLNKRLFFLFGHLSDRRLFGFKL